MIRSCEVTVDCRASNFNLISFPSPRGEPPPPIDWATLFGNCNPVEVEVGFGKGLFLLTSALDAPSVNFFGIEIVRKLQLYTATRMAVRNLTNVRLACSDAQPFMDVCIPDASVQAVHVYFPDPWWKKRHKKRRVFTSEFAAGAARILHSGGHLSIATDVEEYFGVMMKIVEELPTFRLISQSIDATKPEKEHLTNFERKAHEQGRAVYRALYQKHQIG